MTDLPADTVHRIVAQTLYGEARGGGLLPMEDVGCVIMRRARIGGWWGSTPAAVCQAPWQFSCWNPNDPNRPKMEAVDLGDPSYALAFKAAADVLAGRVADRTMGADSYFAIGLPTPEWAKDPHARHTATVWRHTFWQTRTPSASRPNLSVHAVMAQDEMSAADALNAASLARIQAAAMGPV